MINFFDAWTRFAVFSAERTLKKKQKRCIWHLCALRHNPTRNPKLLPDTNLFFLAFIPQPVSICYVAVFYAELTCHFEALPCLPVLTFYLVLGSIYDCSGALFLMLILGKPSELPCDLDWPLKVKALSAASLLRISHFIPWHLTLRHHSQFSEIAIAGTTRWLCLGLFIKLPHNSLASPHNNTLL